jgi:hypothetical protein
LDGEDVILPLLLRRPDLRPLAELDGAIRRGKSLPIEVVPSMRRTLQFARVPGPLRRLALWLALAWFGRCRARHVGTFALSSLGSVDGDPVQMTGVLTSSVHIGPFDAEGSLDVYLTFDHRVYDGGTAARVLIELERVLLTEILAEVRAGSPAAAA